MATKVTERADLDLHFPAAGVDDSDAFFKQTPVQITDGKYARTTPSAVNCRAFLSDRMRGGSRPGLSKFSAGRVADFIIQELNTITTQVDTMELNNSGRLVNLIAVAEGNVYRARAGDTAWTAATNSSSSNPPLNFSGIMQSSACVQKLFFADGVNYMYYDALTNVVDDWEAAEGTLPADSANNFPTLICTWRGRIILSGLLKDGQAVFASAVDDPFDWDYAPVEFTPTQAWALATGQEGLVGDRVSGLCPFTDDVLIIFCDTSIIVLRGDPADGGRKDFITDQIGAAYGQAWCRDPYGNIYFVSNRMGIYVMRPGQQPQRISQPIEQLVEATNTGTTNIRLGYDDQHQCIHIFYSPLEEPGPTQHLTFELRPQAWQPMQFANPNHDPLAMCVFDGNEAGSRVLLLGSWDGYIRQFDDDALNDDGTAIQSFVFIGPLLTATSAEIMLHELQAILGTESGDVDYEVLVGATAEEAVSSEPILTGTFEEGRNFTESVRRAGHAIYVKLSSENKWAMEAIRATVEPLGKVRQRG